MVIQVLTLIQNYPKKINTFVKELSNLINFLKEIKKIMN